jgi:hypothetical protein
MDVRPLSSGCLALPGAVALGHLELSPYPFEKDELASFFVNAKASPSGLLVKGF